MDYIVFRRRAASHALGVMNHAPTCCAATVGARFIAPAPHPAAPTFEAEAQHGK